MYVASALITGGRPGSVAIRDNEDTEPKGDRKICSGSMTAINIEQRVRTKFNQKVSFMSNSERPAYNIVE